MSHKADFGKRKIMMTKKSITQEYIIIINIYAPINEALKCIVIQTRLKKEIDKSTILARYFTPLSK